MSERFVDRTTGPARATLRAVASAALAASLALAGSAGFNTADAQAQPRGSTAGGATPAAQGSQEGADIDALIDHLRESLKITPEQEPAWREVARVMRENAATLSRLAEERAEHAQTATALDDLKSYAEIAQAHAAATKRMIPVFQALYDSMPAGQKKVADDEFRRRLREHARAG